MPVIPTGLKKKNCSWHKSASPEKKKTGVSSDISGLFLSWGIMVLSASAVC